MTRARPLPLTEAVSKPLRALARACALAALCLAAPGAMAQTQAPGDAAAAARAAVAMIEEASVALQEAEGARDRVAALTDTVRGYEAGLAAMRDGLRAVTIREQQLTRELEAREGEIGQLLAVLQTIGRTAQGPVLLLHPSGPTGTARAGILLADIAPALQQRATALRRDLDEVTTLRRLQEDAREQLAQGLSGAQEARTALSQAIANRTDLPQRFAENAMQTAAIIASTETLEGFASALIDIEAGNGNHPLPDLGQQKGALPLPVEGLVILGPGEADSAGIARPGIVVATRPRALVTTPASATIRYLGPLLDLGQVVILEPQRDMLMVLAGMGTVFGTPGQVLPAGSPVGLMGGEEAQLGAVLSTSGEGAGSAATESLYIEIRQGTEAVDPLEWFGTPKD